ncbi:MAG TPA: response regulator transcription factor [Pyrinomonadaceae bacterium]|jgi:DNA-binding NarL/FixJ family response regulator|nr:response regulator transcription factor [Pyrinomonadaceae bacterium]
MSKIRILLAEDHETVRAGLRLIVNAQSDMEVVGEASDGRAALARALELLPDIVLMDVSMPQLNGLKATEKLKATCPQVKVLTLTRHTDYGYLQQLLRAGASGYVLKQSAPAELLHAIRAVAAGGKYLDPAVAGKVIGNYSGQMASLRGAAQGGRDLSEREAEVLRLIAWGHSNKEIAARLQLSVKTIEAHKANAMKRLGMTSRIDIVRFAILQGWLQDT